METMRAQTVEEWMVRFETQAFRTGLQAAAKPVRGGAHS